MNQAVILKKASVADALLEQLSALGLRHVFLVPGMQIDPLVKALAHHAVLRPILASHELAAGYMADGYARASGGIGASFAIGGPGAANLVGAAITAKADRSPVLFVTGNIPLAAQGRGEFQDAGPQGSNDVEVFRAALGAAANCDQDGFPVALDHCLQRLRQRQPAHLGLDMEVQAASASPGRAADATAVAEPLAIADATLPADLLAAGRILLVVGVEALATAAAIAELAREFGLLLATDAAARGLLPEDAALVAGHVGFMPHPRVQAALEGPAELRADRVLVLGGSDQLLSQLQKRHDQVRPVTMAALARWHAAAPVYADDTVLAGRSGWRRRLQGIERPSGHTVPGAGLLSYADVVDAVAAALPDDAACVVDAGQVRRIAVARWCCRQPRSLFVAEGMAPMGWSLGAAIGVQLAQPRRRVVALLGDGAMRMHGIEIGTAARYRLPILYLLFDNGAYGTVLARMAGEAEADTARLPATDWCAFATALGVAAVAVDSLPALQAALAGFVARDAPQLIVARVPAVEPAAYGEATGIDWGLPGAQASMDT